MAGDGSPLGAEGSLEEARSRLTAASAAHAAEVARAAESPESIGSATFVAGQLRVGHEKWVHESQQHSALMSQLTQRELAMQREVAALRGENQQAIADLAAVREGENALSQRQVDNEEACG